MQPFLAVITPVAGAVTPPGSGGPVDPGYSPPWARPRPPSGPVDPGYSPPWAQVRPPVDPGYSPPWAQVPGSGGSPPYPDGSLPLFPFHPITVPPGGAYPPGVTPPGSGPAPTGNAVVIPIPPSDPPVPPPAGVAPGSAQMLVWFGPGTKPTTAWVAPFASTGPVAPPTETPPPA